MGLKHTCPGPGAPGGADVATGSGTALCPRASQQMGSSMCKPPQRLSPRFNLQSTKNGCSFFSKHVSVVTKLKQNHMGKGIQGNSVSVAEMTQCKATWLWDRVSKI